MEQQVGLFFVVNGNIFFHGCSLTEAENYGDFKIYNRSHFEIWEKCYFENYKVDYDYFPRGRITYNKNEERYWLYKDCCIEDNLIQNWLMNQGYSSILLKEDEHYRCYMCNKFYVDILNFH